MRPDQIYTSTVLSIQISDSGIRWKAEKYWQYRKLQGYTLVDAKRTDKNCIPAYSLAELGHLIPFGFFNQMVVHKLLNTFFQVKLGDRWEVHQSEVDARAAYLLHLIKTGVATVSMVKDSVSPVVLPPNLIQAK